MKSNTCCSKSGIFIGLNFMNRFLPNLNISDISSSPNIRNDPILKFGMVIHVLNLIGIPPLPGFWGKLFLFIAAARNIDPLYVAGLPWLTIVGIVASIISIYYYLNIVRPLLTFQQTYGDIMDNADVDNTSYEGWWERYSLLISGILVIAVGLIVYRLFFIL
jgi:NADH:ubiquinone oxidoreductase subunit 2 (subunit N)